MEPGYAARPWKRATAAMVAAKAGVSAATVSLVVNGKVEGRVSEELIVRVQRAIVELDYVVDHSASVLSSGTNRMVIMVAPDISNPFFAHVIAGVQAAFGSSYQLLLSVSDRGQVPEVADVKKLMAIRSAGMLIDAPSQEFMSGVPQGMPTVLIDAPGAERFAPSVNIDVETGAGNLALHLAERGHKRVAYLDSLTQTMTFQLRRRAFWRAGLASGIEEVEPTDIRSTLEIESASEAFIKAWEQWSAAGITAVVCATDVQAYGVLEAARELGGLVPGELAVTGFDDLPYSRIAYPSLTSVALPGHDLGHTAGVLLRLIMDGGTVRSPEPLPSRLMIRDSSSTKV